MAYDTFDPDIAASLAGTANNTIDGLNVAEGCPAGNMNAGLRGLAANFRQLYNAIIGGEVSIAARFAAFMPRTGGAFTSDITRNTAGAYRFNANPSALGGRTTWQPTGTAFPASPQEGDEVIEY